MWMLCWLGRDYERTKRHSMNQITVLTGPERHRRWREDERRTVLAAASLLERRSPRWPGGTMWRRA